VAEVKALAPGLGLDIVPVSSFPTASGYIGALVEATLPFLAEGCVVLASAHGLPRRIVQAGDPYVGEVRATFAALVSRLPAGTRCSQAFQSRLGPVEWTRPYLIDEVRRLGAEGVKALVVVPLSFVSENLETLYELDIELRGVAIEAGVTSFRRVPTAGCHPAFIATLAEAVRAAGGAAKEETNVA
jgi:ferrochelatase